MKKNNLFNTLALLLIVSSFFGCKKIIENQTKFNNISELHTELKYTPQVFQVSAGTNATITANKGTRLRFKPGSFKDGNGNVITSGEVTVSLIETPKAKDMLRNSVVTLTQNGGLLQSGGSINIQASQNNQPVQAGEYGLDFKQDEPSTTPMQIFTGNENSGEMQNWNNQPQNSAQGTSIDSAGIYYTFDNLSTFNWINCDQFYNDPNPQTNIDIDVTGQDFKLGEVGGFIILPDINANTLMIPIDANKSTLLGIGASYQLPTGLKAHFIVLGIHNDKYYYGQLKNQTITTGFSRSITVSEKSLDELKSLIDAL